MPIVEEWSTDVPSLHVGVKSYLADVGRNEVTDELLHVAVDGATLLDGGHDRREVIVSQHHLRRRLGHSCARAHGDTNLSLLQSRSVVHTVASLWRTRSTLVK